MDEPTQSRLLERIAAHLAASGATTTDTAETTLTVDPLIYTDQDRWERERALLSTVPTAVGLSGLLPSPETFAAVDVGDVPVVLTRDGNGALHASLNVCRHRGATVVDGCGLARRLICGYHGWTYRLDGTASQRRGDEYFDSDADGLVSLPVAEHDGVIWVSGDPSAVIPEDPSEGAGIELGPLGLADHRLFATTRFVRPMNWKLAVETFAESFHVAVLHQETLAPMIRSDATLSDTFGRHGRMVVPRRGIEEVIEGTSLLPHATILWFLVPGTVLIHQQDHVQLCRSRPGTHPGECVLDVTLYVPTDSPRSEDHWRRNFDLLVEVTDTEDFSTAAGIQLGAASGRAPTQVVGRNEPSLQHLHRSLDRLLDGLSE